MMDKAESGASIREKTNRSVVTAQLEVGGRDLPQRSVKSVREGVRLRLACMRVPFIEGLSLGLCAKKMKLDSFLPSQLYVSTPVRYNMKSSSSSSSPGDLAVAATCHL